MKKYTHIIVAGGRDFNDYGLLEETLKRHLPDLRLIISGGAVGADSLSVKYAVERKIDYYVHYPDWKRYGRAAGVKRNRKMVEALKREVGCNGLLVAFWNGKSRVLYG